MPPVHMLQNAKKNAVFPVHMFVAFPVTFFSSEFYIFLIRISHLWLHFFGQNFTFCIDRIPHFFCTLSGCVGNLQIFNFTP